MPNIEIEIKKVKAATKYKILIDVIWFIVAILIATLIPLPFNKNISTAYQVFLSASLFVIVTYFRWVVFPMRSYIFSSFWPKFILFFVNFALFYYFMQGFSNFTKVFDGFEFTFDKSTHQSILFGTSTDIAEQIKNLTIFCGSITLVLIVMIQFRIIHIIFKFRQVPLEQFRKL